MLSIKIMRHGEKIRCPQKILNNTVRGAVIIIIIIIIIIIKTV